MARSGVVNRVATRIRPMAAEDIPVVVQLEDEIYPQPWSAGVFADELALENRAYLVAEGDEGIIGYAGMLTVDEDAHITTMAVAARGRRRRLGSRLMIALIDEALRRGARHLTLEVRVSNLGARRLYEHFGMTAVGVRKNYYRDEDAIVMWATDIDGSDYSARLDEIRKDLR